MKRQEIERTALKKLQLALVMIASLLGVILLLFTSTKGNVHALLDWVPGLRVLGYFSSWVVLFALLIEGCVLVYALWPWRTFLRNWSYKEKLQSLLAVLLFFLSAFPVGNYLKEGYWFYQNWMWYFTFWCFGMGLVIVLSLLLFHAPSLGKERWSERLHNYLFSKDWQRVDTVFFIALSVWVLLATILVSLLVLRGIPHVQDSIAQFFQARIFAMGQWAIEKPPLWHFFERIYLFPDQGQVYSIYPPGHAVIQAIGVILRVPYLVGPVLTLASLWLVYVLAKHVYSLPIARMSCFLFSFSPFVIFMGGGFMNHTTCLFFLLVFLYSLYKGLRFSQWQWMLLAGFAWSFAFITRPQTTIVFLIVIPIWWWVYTNRDRKRTLWAASAFALGVLPCALFWMTFNAHTTGSPTLLGYVKYFRGNPIGLWQRNWESGRTGYDNLETVYHTPVRGVANFLNNLHGLHFFLWGWPIPSLTLAFWVFLPRMNRQFNEWIWVLLILLLGGIYFFYYYQDYCYGPRFLYETVPLWCLLSARGISEVMAKIASWPRDSKIRFHQIFYGWIIVFFLIAFCSVWVERVVVMSDTYWGTHDEIIAIAREEIAEENALIFVDREENQMALYSYLHPSLDRGWIVALDINPEENQKLMDHYSGWPVYEIRYNTDDPSLSGVDEVHKIRSGRKE